MDTQATREARWDRLGGETAELLSSLVRLDTSNPPGNESVAADCLADYLKANGIEGELVGDQADRMNYVARLEGQREGPTLLLLGHTDVVPAESCEWSVPPFSAEIRDGQLWGRGTVDMKNFVAAQAVALARLAESGADFAGTVVLCAAVDEEVGNHGVKWLVENRPDLIRCDYVLNEGGGEFVEFAGRRTQLLTVGEKGTAQFKLVFKGEAGHAAVPLVDESAVATLARAITALVDHQPETHETYLPAALIERCVPDEALCSRLCSSSTARSAVAELRAVEPALAKLITPLYGVTFAPTIVKAGDHAVNVYPSRAEVRVDCRTLPGQSIDDVMREVESALAGLDDWELVWTDVNPGNASRSDTPLAEAIERVMDELVPEGFVAPMCCVAYTDCNSIRAAWPDVIAYGFLPWVVDDYFAVKQRMHNHDERIALRDLGFQTDFVESLVRRLMS